MNKYGAVKTRGFDSKHEARRASELELLERAGQIHSLEKQVRFDLWVNKHLVCFYKADFVYFENGERVVEDAKGHQTPVYILKKKLMKACLGIDIKET